MEKRRKEQWFKWIKYKESRKSCYSPFWILKYGSGTLSCESRLVEVSKSFLRTAALKRSKICETSWSLGSISLTFSLWLWFSPNLFLQDWDERGCSSYWTRKDLKLVLVYTENLVRGPNPKPTGLCGSNNEN